MSRLASRLLHQFGQPARLGLVASTGKPTSQRPKDGRPPLPLRSPSLAAVRGMRAGGWLISSRYPLGRRWLPVAAAQRARRRQVAAALGRVRLAVAPTRGRATAYAPQRLGIELVSPVAARASPAGRFSVSCRRVVMHP